MDGEERRLDDEEEDDVRQIRHDAEDELDERIEQDGAYDDDRAADELQEEEEEEEGDDVEDDAQYDPNLQVSSRTPHSLSHNSMIVRVF